MRFFLSNQQIADSLIRINTSVESLIDQLILQPDEVWMKRRFPRGIIRQFLLQIRRSIPVPTDRNHMIRNRCNPFWTHRIVIPRIE